MSYDKPILFKPACNEKFGVALKTDYNIDIIWP